MFEGKSLGSPRLSFEPQADHGELSIPRLVQIPNKQPFLKRFTAAARRCTLAQLAGRMPGRRPDAATTDLEFWQRRVRAFGRRSVLNMAHGEDEFEAVTRAQAEILLPRLQSLLDGSEKLALDFGCGPGRFTGFIADIAGSCIGMDPIVPLLRMAPSHPAVRYAANPEGVIPLRSGAVDVVWCCLVLGGIRGEALRDTANEIGRVLRSQGLLYLVESAADAADAPEGAHWRHRATTEYMSLFPSIMLKTVGTYTDVGQRITILAGRKR